MKPGLEGRWSQYNWAAHLFLQLSLFDLVHLRRAAKDALLLRDLLQLALQTSHLRLCVGMETTSLFQLRMQLGNLTKREKRGRGE